MREVKLEKTEKSELDRRLEEARVLALKSDDNLTRVGTLSEKLLHRVLKFYTDTDQSHHEVSVYGSIADVLNGEGIFEIQTRSFEKLVPKLIKYLPNIKVTLIHPLVATRYVNYTDRESGELTERKKSPKHDGVNRAACELYKISDFLLHPNLTVKLIFLDFEDFRYKLDRKRWQKPSENLIRRVPVGVERELVLRSRDDYKIFLPDSLSDTFSAKELSRLIKLDSRRTHNTLSLLLRLGLIEKCGESGKAFIYAKTE